MKAKIETGVKEYAYKGHFSWEVAIRTGGSGFRIRTRVQIQVRIRILISVQLFAAQVRRDSLFFLTYDSWKDEKQSLEQNYQVYPLVIFEHGLVALVRIVGYLALLVDVVGVLQPA